MMAKISGILPSNQRITSIDVENERPLRSGMPSFGQPISSTANTRDEFQRVSVSDSELELLNYGSNAKMIGPGSKVNEEVILEPEQPKDFERASSLDVKDVVQKKSDLPSPVRLPPPVLNRTSALDVRV